jgi:DNA polymerase-4
MEILRQFTPMVEQVSVDEAYLDVTGSTALFGDGPRIARRIKDRVKGETGLTCSIGVASNRFLAKLASDLEKPDGLTVVPTRGKAEFIAPLAVSRIPGIGKRTAETLASLGIGTIGQLAAASLPRLRAALGQSAEYLAARARGEGSAAVETDERDAKSLSRETTFGEFLAGRAEAAPHLLELADSVAERLRGSGMVSAVVILKIRDDKFNTMTRSRSLPAPTDLTEVIYRTTVELLREKVDLRGRKIRLLGISASGLAPRNSLPEELFPDRRTGRARQVAETVDRLKSKLGRNAITRAGLLRKR